MTEPKKQAETKSLARRILREPLVHFLLIGVLVFVAFGQRPQMASRSVETIEITQTQIDRISGQFEAVWRRPPTAAELDELVDALVRETVYYREALALGLDRNDTVIRRRLQQKMEFIGDAAADALTPNDVTLQAFLDANSERFILPVRLTFQQIFLGPDDPEAALADLAAGADPALLGRASLLPGAMEAVVASTVDGTFGEGFFARVSGLDLGDWQGPVLSSYGVHLVRLTALVPAAVPTLADVRDKVAPEWRQAEADRLREAQYQALRSRYDVILPATKAAQ